MRLVLSFLINMFLVFINISIFSFSLYKNFQSPLLIPIFKSTHAQFLYFLMKLCRNV